MKKDTPSKQALSCILLFLFAIALVVGGGMVISMSFEVPLHIGTLIALAIGALGGGIALSSK